MNQPANFLTFGVDDLDYMKNWYEEKLGWTMIKACKNIVFFQLNGFSLGLFPDNELAEGISVIQSQQGFKRFTFIGYHSEEEVDEVFDKLRKEGVRILKEPEKIFWGGYSGYIADPEDNYWELAYNPFFAMMKKENTIIHSEAECNLIC